jgi:ribonuclease BN (tRNA processing enzyme)
MAARLHVLGAGTALPRPSRAGRCYGPAGYAYEPVPGGPLTLFDIGPGSVRQLGNLGLELERVERVVLSHFHPDHCLDLFALTFARRNPAFVGQAPLELLGPRGLSAWYESGVASLGEWVRERRLQLVEQGPEAWAAGRDQGGFRLFGVPTGHTPNAMAWRIEAPAHGGALVYSGDSGERPQLAELARDAGLFLCECSFPDGRESEHHLTPSGAARLFRAAGARRLLLTHFYPELDPDRAAEGASSLAGVQVAAAYDGLCVEL